MPSVKAHTTIPEYQQFVHEVYGLHNDRFFTTTDMLSQIQRFVMRGLKGIRKKDRPKIQLNLLIALSWFISLLNQLHISAENIIWTRFPYLCSYCGEIPCACKAQKIKRRQHVLADEEKRPKTLEQFQKMFLHIYPPERRTLEDAGVHLAEELGELTEVAGLYRSDRSEKQFQQFEKEAADFFSCLMGVFNSLNINVAKELSQKFARNCHVCKKAPCKCSFQFIANFKS